MAMLNVSALLTGYDTVGDHTEFLVEVRLAWLLLSLFSSILLINLMYWCRRSRAMAACGASHVALVTLISCTRVSCGALATSLKRRCLRSSGLDGMFTGLLTCLSVRIGVWLLSSSVAFQ